MTRHGNRDRYAAPANTFQTRDGAWVHLVVAGDPMFAALSRAMGQAQLAEDARFRSNEARMQNVAALEQIISEWTGSLPATELVQQLERHGVPAAKVASVADLIDNAQLAHRGQILNMQHPKAGQVPMQGFAVQLGGSPMRLRHPPPMLGEHTEAVLSEWLALDAHELTRLREQGIV